MRFDGGHRQSRRRMKVALSGWGRRPRIAGKTRATETTTWLLASRRRKDIFSLTSNPASQIPASNHGWRHFWNSHVHHACSLSVPRPSLHRREDECEVRTFHRIVTLKVNIVGSPSFSCTDPRPSSSPPARPIPPSHFFQPYPFLPSPRRPVVDIVYQG